MLHNDYFSILDSSVTNQQIVDAGYEKGITREKLDGSQVLVQCHIPLPDDLLSFVVIKNQTLIQITPIMQSPEWHDSTGGML